MRRFLALCLAVACSTAGAQQSPDAAALDLALAFEGGLDTALPAPWSNTAGITSLDREIARSGQSSGRIDRDAGSPGRYSAFTIAIPMDFTGAEVELRGYLRTREVTGYAGFWVREDGPTGVLAFDNMSQRRINGTSEWTEYRVPLPLAPAARNLVFGVLLNGTGTVWADDIEILVDGRPLREAPRLVREPTILEKDTEFAAGSGITHTQLNRRQIEHLSVLGRVWGFLKYHHPRVANGDLHWDFELFRVLPAVLVVPDANARNEALFAWVRGVGEPDPCNPCAAEPRDAQLFADLDWIHDTQLLGRPLSGYLENVYRNRWAGGAQFYATATRIANPVFENEPAYQSLAAPDSGYRLAALFRYWNMIEYWFPNRDVIGEPWPGVLTEFLPVFAAAETRDAYALALATLIARINDTHAQLRNTDVLPPRGTCTAPVAVRFVEGAATVGAYSSATKGPETGLRIGDVITAIDSTPVAHLVTERARFYSASNKVAKLHRIASRLFHGPCTPVEASILRGTERLSLTIERVEQHELDVYAATRRDRSGDTFQWLHDAVAYLKLSTIKAADVKGYIESAQAARGLIIDIRNYPDEFVVFALGGHLVQEPTEFVQFSGVDLGNPGTFVWGARPVLQPLAPYFGGKVVILVDETTISQAEYTAMALRATPRAIVVGSTTAGADGNVSALPLPGGFTTAISGLGVFYPDRSPTQRIGIVPDVFVAPTVAGIRDGRDEVLERALGEILGADAANPQ